MQTFSRDEFIPSYDQIYVRQSPLMMSRKSPQEPTCGAQVWSRYITLKIICIESPIAHAPLASCLNI